MDNRERYQRDGALGFSVPGLVLPNLIRITDDDENVDQDSAPATDSIQTSANLVEPEPELSDETPPDGRAEPCDADVYIVADAADTIEVMEGLDMDTVLTTVQVTESLRVRLPPFGHKGETWAKVQAFANPTGAVAVGYARVATDKTHLLQGLRF